ncbi:MAG: hypothetical protein K8S54_05425 [Spirochaetia bacterium]|nr:hypothetical protein [Spirochaetia bacterium]
MRGTSALVILLFSCSAFTKVQQSMQSLDSRTGYKPVPTGFTKLRVVLLPFANSAQMKAFDIVPDGDYKDDILSPSDPAPPLKSEAPTDTDAWRTAVSPDSLIPLTIGPGEPVIPVNPGPDPILPGDLYREIAETELFQSGRFEVIPYHLFLEERRRIDPELADPLSQITAAKNLNVQLLITGDCTDFEIKRSSSYWKVPFWALLLVGSFAIDDKRFRAMVIETLIRLMFVFPVGSDFWKAGIGWEDVDVDVEVGLNLRAVQQGGSISFSEESTTRRTESVRNLDLLIWKQTNRIRIQKTSAGRQIRIGVTDLVRKISVQVDQGLR